MKILIVLLCWTLCLSADGREQLPLFGVIDKADLQMQSCEFDPNTDVVYLIDEGEANIFSSIEAITERRIRIKILKESGIAKANIKIPYYSHEEYEKIDGVKGYTYNLDAAGNVVTSPLEPSLVFDKKVDNNYSEVSFPFSGVKVGSVVEYKYRLTKQRGYANIDDWYFQRAEAVRYSSYHVFIPTSFIFTMQVVNRQPVEATKPAKEGEGYTFVMRNIPGLRDEPFQAGLKDYIQRVDFQLSGYMETGGFKQSYITTWQALTEKVLEDEFLGFQLKKAIPADDLKAKLVNAKSNKEKTEQIYHYVQKNMEWNGYYGKYSQDGIKKAWDKKEGNIGDINLILLTLLKDAGVTAYPCLVSTRSHGKINVAYPFLDQFNALYVYVLADGKPYILNAADKFCPPHLIPGNVQFTQGFVVDKKAGGFIELSSYDKKYMQNSNMRLQVAENGSFTGNGNLTSFDYAKVNNRRLFTSDKLKERLSDHPNMRITIDDVSTSGDADDAAPLDANLSFSGTLQQSGDYTFLPYNIFTGLGQSPFVAEKRQTDIDFGYTQHFIISGTYTIPETYTVEELPKNVKMIMPDTSIIISRITQQQGNMIQFKVSLEFAKPQYDADEYPLLKEFYKKVYALLNEQIALKKK